jgi:hypothetical protein
MVYFSLPVRGQTYRRQEINLENFIEELFAIQQTDDNYEDMYESLLQVFLHPISLNNAQPEALKSLYVLSPFQINNFFQYRENFGPLLSLYELQAIPGFDLETIYKLLPFVTLEDGSQVTNRSLLERIIKEREGYLIFRQNKVWETRKGFTPPDTLKNGNLTSRYLGNSSNLYGRFRIQHTRDFSLGFTIDKDPGEEFLWDPQTKRYGFNFLSYHFSLFNKGKWKAITVGDFQAQFGQGLVYGAGFSVGKGAETITTVRRSSIGLRPYTSAMEFGFFRGAAATYGIGRTNFTLMVSDTPRDGNVQVILDSLEMEDLTITSFQTSGLHRTSSEIAYKDKIRERNFGANVHFTSRDNNFQVGYNALYTQFSQPYFRKPQVYNQFEFTGQNNHLNSLYITYSFQNYFFFGEHAVSKSGGMGSVVGLMASLNRRFDFSMLWRKFDRNFHSFYGNAFSEGTRPINEQGIYMGFNFRPNSKIQWALYYDYFKFPWLKFRVYSPSTGQEWLSRISYSPSRNLMLFLQMREEEKSRNISEIQPFQSTYQLATGIKRNFVFNLDYVLDKHWSIKSRVTASTFGFNGTLTRGYAISQDLNVDYQKWRISTRFALFDTEDYDNRQYLYERNVLWAFSIPAMNGQGMRYYILGQYRISPKLTFWARFARTTYTDRETIGSGLQQIDGNTQTETTFQLRYQFNR